MSDINWAGLVQRTNPFDQFAEGMTRGNDIRQERERTNLFRQEQEYRMAERKRELADDQENRLERGILGHMARKDPRAARAKAVEVGQPDLAEQFGKLDESQRKAAAERAGVLAAYVDSFQGQDPAAIKAQIMQDAPALVELGFTQEQIAAFDPSPQNIARLKAEALGLKGVLEERRAEAKERREASKPIEMDPSKTYVVPDAGGAVPDTPIATARPQTDALFDALIQQESGGRPGVLGPKTQYGQAEGMTQMLPATAEAMARKVGVPWNPALMRENTPRAAEYQKRLGRAYFEEGLEKYGGDPRKALMYYHGGPDERLWGPKTRAYADQVLARVEGSDAAMGGAGGDDIAPPGYKMLQRGQPERWVDLPGGGQRNTRTGETKNVPNPKPGRLTSTALNQQNDHLTSLQAASAINTRMERVRGLLTNGQLDLGLAKNLFSQGMNAVGLSNEESRNYASLRADLEKMRNDSLRLNKGVQTEGDAQRAWNELLTNLNDPKLVMQRLEEIDAYNRQAMAFHKDMVTQIREDAGMAPIDLKKFEAKPPDIRRTKPPPPKGKDGAWSIRPVG